MRPIRNGIRNRLSTLLWCILAVVFVYIVIYFFQHVSDSAFLSSTMGNLFATVMGVLVGVPIALWINTRHTQAQERKLSEEADAQRRREIEQVRQNNKELLRLHLEALQLELQNNRFQMEELRKGLSQYSPATAEWWSWISTIADGIEVSSYAALKDSGVGRVIPRILPYEIESAVDASYMMAKGLINRVKLWSAEDAFLRARGDDKEHKGPELEFIESICREGLRWTNIALEELQRLGPLWKN